MVECFLLIVMFLFFIYEGVIIMFEVFYFGVVDFVVKFGGIICG